MGRLRWLLPVLSAVLLCFSAVGAQAHGVPAPTQSAGRVGATDLLIAASAAIVSQPLDQGHLVDHDDHACPGGSNHMDHAACAGIACHAAASDAGPATDLQPSHTTYQCIATKVGGGRIIAPLFHPPKI